MQRLTTAPKIATAPTYGRLPYAALLAHAAPLPQHTTAAERGTEWMAKYGCTPNCVMDHSQPHSNPGWHPGPQAACPAPATLVEGYDGDADEPLIAARVTTVNDTPEVFGITTKLWVDLGTDTMELSLTEARQFMAALEETFLPQMRSLLSQLAEVAKGDVPRNEEAVARWRAEQNARSAAERAEMAAKLPASTVTEADAARDREANVKAAAQHPHLGPFVDLPTTVCVFDRVPSTSVRTGQLGNRYGLCDSCAAMVGESGQDQR